MGPRGDRRALGVAAGAITAGAALVAALTVVAAGGLTGLQVRFALVVVAIALTAVGIGRNRPTHRRPWLLLLAGMTSSALGDVAVLVVARQGPLTANVPLDAWLTVAAGVLFLAGILDAVRPVGRGNLGSALDALIATLAVGSLIWQLLVVPAAAPGWAGTGTELAGALQVAILLAVLVLLGRVAARLPAGRRAAAGALSVGVLLAVVAFVLGAIGAASGGDVYSGARAVLGVLANLAAAAAALHPSMRVLTERRPATPEPVSVLRSLGLGLALTAPPGVLLVATLRGTAVALVSLSVTWVALAAAVLTRVHLLQLGRETAQDELARSQERLVSLVAHTGDVVLLVATPVGGDPAVRFASPSCVRLTGRTPSEVGRLPLEAIAEADDDHTLIGLILGTTPLPRVGDVRVRHTDGSHRWVEVVVAEAPQEEERSVVVTLRDVDARKRAALELAEAALRDELTGLWNRRGLYALLEAALSIPEDPGYTTAVILGDLDGFKAVNDREGHAAGDEVLRVLARRLEGAVREGDAVGRVGGDEFLVVCSVDGVATVRAIAERVVAVGRRPFNIDGVDHVVGISVGVALAEEGTTVDGLVLQADRALYAAKAAGKGQVRFADGLEVV
ncbi:sensor domain-containing diguanylate cyclase [Nitriliruptor alkaliphilus]|uniref:sensor domain-containing diguanylate cyclase n=1 Tax=Nitriliruptor alkaliphilus TaxID=427918 RepID=UPI000AA0DE57|nr:sensor domain-containing diguanylate cyclase [Nitriliruptor alkaliphilus]